MAERGLDVAHDVPVAPDAITDPIADPVADSVADSAVGAVADVVADAVPDAVAVDRRRTGEMLVETRMADTLRDIGDALVSELDLDRVVQRVTDAATGLIGAQFGSFFYNISDERGDAYMLYALAGASRQAFEGFPMPRATELFAPTFRGEGIIRLDDVTRDPRYGRNPPHHGMPPGHLPVRSYLAAPVVSRRGEVLGGLFFGHPQPGMFTAQHERLVAGIAAPAAIAIDNARLYQAAQRDREAAQRLAARLAQMQTVSASLASANLADEIATVIVTSAARALGCARASLYVLEPDGRTLRLLRAVGYEGRYRKRWDTIDMNDHLPSSDALRMRTLIVMSGDDDWAVRYPDVPVHPDRDRSASLAVIPLALGDQLFGVSTFGWDAARRFEEDEARFLEALGDQCSQALERARLYEVERETARTLQRSLLPPRAPEIPGMEVAAIYRAGDRSVTVGGDFYDVFRIGPNRWGIAMGDVCGRGASAAARTALVRYTLRALAARGESPSAVLHQLNEAVLAESRADDRFCATVFAHVELDHCGAWVTLACAGHPRPIVVRRAGWTDLRGQPGLLIGVFDNLEVTEDRVGLGPGDSLVFFTDGISEARNSDGEQFVEEELPETLLDAADLDAKSLAESLQQAALDFSGGRVGDDLAVLAIRVPPEAEDDPDGRLVAALGADVTTALPEYPVPLGGHPARPLAPREARISLPPHPVSARAARRFLASLLMSWRMPELLEGDAALLLSELATNAVLHARSAFTVVVRYDGSKLRVEVGDASHAEPRLRRTRANDGPGGRGLMLVDTLSIGWGVVNTAKGKRVWFELPAPRRQ